MNPNMDKKEWHPVPLYVPDLPMEPPPDSYPKKKAPELEDEPATETDPKPKNRTSSVINGEDDREWDPFKGDDEM